MNTLRVCATIGLGLALALGSGCKSDSDSTKKDAGHPDTRRVDAPRTTSGPDSATASGPCIFNGTTYQPGQSFTIGCNTYTCTGGDNVTSKPAACSDAGPTPDVARGPDLATDRDTTTPSDTRPGEAGAPIDGGSKDVQAGEAGQVNKDVGGNKDTLVPDVFVPQDTTQPEPDALVSEDTASPSPDLSVVVADTAPPVVTCISESGQKYYAGGGVCFPCASNLCVCDAIGVITQAASCSAVDAL
jgi:hypothetical protein